MWSETPSDSDRNALRICRCDDRLSGSTFGGVTFVGEAYCGSSLGLSGDGGEGVRIISGQTYLLRRLLLDPAFSVRLAVSKLSSLDTLSVNAAVARVRRISDCGLPDDLIIDGASFTVRVLQCEPEPICLLL